MRILPRTVPTARRVGLKRRSEYWSMQPKRGRPAEVIRVYSDLRFSADAAGLNPMHVCSRHVASKIVDNR